MSPFLSVLVPCKVWTSLELSREHLALVVAYWQLRMGPKYYYEIIFCKIMLRLQKLQSMLQIPFRKIQISFL